MTAMTDDTIPVTPRAIRDEMIVFVVMAALLADRAADRHLSVLRHAGAVLCAARLRLQSADRLWRPVVVRPRDVSGHRRLLHRACAEGVGPVARARHSGRHRRRRRRSASSPALVAIRRQGIYFSMITLALSQLLYFIYLQTPFTHGEDGIQGIPQGHSVRHSSISRSPTTLYYVILAGFLVRFPADLPHHQLAVRRGAESDPRERAARDLARLQDRPVQAAGLHPVRHAGGLCRLAEGVRRAECLADRRALDACRARSC